MAESGPGRRRRLGPPRGQRRFVVNAGTVRALLKWCASRAQRRFVVEGAGGLGRSLTQQLAAAGEDVVDVPSTRASLLGTDGDRKSDPADAFHVVQVALFPRDLRRVVRVDQTTTLRLLSERHDDLVHRVLNQLTRSCATSCPAACPPVSRPTRPLRP